VYFVVGPITDVCLRAMESPSVQVPAKRAIINSATHIKFI